MTAAGTWPEIKPRYRGPDVATYDRDAPLLGWRVTAVVDGPRLASLLAGDEPPERLTVEPGEPFTAHCWWTKQQVPCTFARFPACHSRHCGVFGACSPRLHRSVTLGGTRAFGVWFFFGAVSVLAGTIRAEHAVPVELELRAAEPPVAETEAIADAYGIRAWALANDAPLDRSRFQLAA